MIENFKLHYAIDVYDKKEVDLLINRMKNKQSSAKEDVVYDSSGKIVSTKKDINYKR
jgi:hypothetical protein